MRTKNKTTGLRVTLSAFCILANICGSAQITTKPQAYGAAGIPEARNLLNGSGLRFTPNKGQIAGIDVKLCPNVLYKGDGGGADIYLRKTGISYVYNNTVEVMHEVNEQIEELVKTGKITEADEQKKKDELLQKQNIKIHRVDMDFAGCNSNVIPTNEDEVEGYNNFYYSHCPNGIINVKQYNKVTYKNIYNNIDVVYSGSTARGLKYDIVLQPHADPNQIKLHWKGAKNIHINREGNLVIKTSLNEFTESIPKVYQNINGKIVDINGKYELISIKSLVQSPKPQENTNDCIVSFKLGTWNPELPLIIDPFVWATYYGGNLYDYANGITTDLSGNVMITGFSASANFPTTVGAYQTAYQGNDDAIVVKFNSNGNRLWATYYGGSAGNGQDHGNDIATDAAGNVVITGFTGSTNFPVTALAFQTVYGGSFQDAFVVKFDPSGLRLWATYCCGNGRDFGMGIAIDAVGNIAITGYTESNNFPISAGAFQPIFAGGGAPPFDAFLFKFNPAGARLWATYYGGTNQDWGTGIAIDAVGNIIITGYTKSNNFPVTALAFQTIFAGGTGGFPVDAFVVKFDANGVRLWATYYGGSGNDFGNGIVTDAIGNVVITGHTTSANFPTTLGAFQTIYGGGQQDGFVVKFAPGGARLWATYHGGNAYEYSFTCAIDIYNNIYILGEWEDTYPLNNGTFPMNTCALQKTFNGVENWFVTKFKPNGERLCSTFIGGGPGEPDLDYGYGIVTSGNYVYVTGSQRTAGGFPVTPGAFQTVYTGATGGSGGANAVIAKFCGNSCGDDNPLSVGFTSSPISLCSNAPVQFNSSVIPALNCDTNSFTYQWTFTGGTPGTSTQPNPGIVYSSPGTYTVKLDVTTACSSGSFTNSISVNSCNTCLLTGQFTKGTGNCAGCGCKEWILVTATGGTSPYSYSWPDGYTNRYKNQLCPGNYNINIKDKNGCSINVNITAP